MRRIKYTDVFSGDDLQHLVDKAIEGLYEKDSRAQIDHIEVKFVHNKWIVNLQGSRPADFHYRLVDISSYESLQGLNQWYEEEQPDTDVEIIRVFTSDSDEGRDLVLEKIYDE